MRQHITDRQIKEDLLRELRHQPHLNATVIEVSVNSHVMTLAGTVENASDRLLVQEAAWRIDGVLEVVNNIKVESPTPLRTDVEIAEAVRHALEWDDLLSGANIQTTVSNGWVALEGTVNLLREREDAERLVRRLAGVRGVYNEITVNSSEVKAENVCDIIGEELKRRADLEAHSIQISLRDGAVTLSGPVQSWEERCAIINAASHAPGVGTVKDCLTIKSSF